MIRETRMRWFEGVGPAWPVPGAPEAQYYDISSTYIAFGIKLGCKTYNISIGHPPTPGLPSSNDLMTWDCIGCVMKRIPSSLEK